MDQPNKALFQSHYPPTSTIFGNCFEGGYVVQLSNGKGLPHQVWHGAMVVPL